MLSEGRGCGPNTSEGGSVASDAAEAMVLGRYSAAKSGSTGFFFFF